MAANNNQQRDDDTIFPLLIIAAVLASIMVAGYFLKPYASTAWLYYAKVEGYLTLATTMDEETRYQAKEMLKWIEESTHTDVTERMYDGIRQTILGKGWHNYILIFIVLLVSFSSWKRHQSYRGAPNLEGLLSTEYKVWPTLEFVRRFNPYQHWNELRGPGRYMLSPFVYCVENGIIKNYKAKSKKDRIYQADVAERVLVESLGVKFTGFRALSPFERVLVVIVAAKYLDKAYPHYNELMAWFSRELAAVDKPAFVEALVNQVTEPIMALLDGEPQEKAGNNKIFSDLYSCIQSGHESTLAKREKNPHGTEESAVEMITRMTKRHAYVKTLMVGLSRTVKRRGKFPPGRLVFFKPWDRNLFLILSNSPYYLPDSASPHRFVSGFSAEVVGVYSHYQHEVFAGRGLEQPFVETGVSSMRDHIARQNLIERGSPE